MNAKEARALSDQVHAKEQNQKINAIYDAHPLFIQRINKLIEAQALKGETLLSLEQAALLALQDERNEIPSPYPYGPRDLPFEFYQDANRATSLSSRNQALTLAALSTLSQDILKRVCSYYISQGYSAFYSSARNKGFPEFILYISWNS